MQGDLRRCRVTLNEVGDEYKRLERTRDNVAASQDSATAERKQLKEVAAAAELLQRQIDSAQHRLSQLDATYETKREAGLQSIEGVCVCACLHVCECVFVRGSPRSHSDTAIAVVLPVTVYWCLLTRHRDSTATRATCRRDKCSGCGRKGEHRGDVRDPWAPRRNQGSSRC